MYYNNNGEPISSKVLKSKLGGSILETEKELYLNKSKKTPTETFSSSGYTINDKILKSDGSTDLNIIQNYIPGNGGKVNRIVVDPVNSNISTKIEQSPTQIEITGKVKFKDDVEFANPPQNNTFTNIYIQNGDAKTSITTNDHSLNYNRNTQFSFAGMAQGYSAKIFPAGSTGEGFRFALQTPSTLLNGIRVQKDPSAEGKSILGVDADKFQVGYGTTTEFYGGVTINGAVNIGTGGFYVYGSSEFNSEVKAKSGLTVSGGANISGDISAPWSTVNINNLTIQPNSSGQGGNLLVKAGGYALFQTNINGEKNLYLSGFKCFKIDHPTDNTKYLQHASVESNQVLNMYSGNVTTDGNGMATVTLPSYFKEINTDYRYVLTVVGQTFAQAIVYQEIDSNNQFKIKTSEPNIKVSWQVTAKRNDTYLLNNPFNDVINK